jgi:hypothetical protein
MGTREEFVGHECARKLERFARIMPDEKKGPKQNKLAAQTFSSDNCMPIAS